jgi:hypothetical protein
VKRFMSRLCRTQNRLNSGPPRASRLCGATKASAAKSAKLAPIYGWFTEGFDTPDLKAAKALLDDLV